MFLILFWNKNDFCIPESYKLFRIFWLQYEQLLSSIGFQANFPKRIDLRVWIHQRLHPGHMRVGVLKNFPWMHTHGHFPSTIHKWNCKPCLWVAENHDSSNHFDWAGWGLDERIFKILLDRHHWNFVDIQKLPGSSIKMKVAVKGEETWFLCGERN